MPKEAVSIVDITVGDGVTLCVDVDKGLSSVHMRTRTHTHTRARARTHARARAHTHTHTLVCVSVCHSGTHSPACRVDILTRAIYVCLCVCVAQWHPFPAQIAYPHVGYVCVCLCVCVSVCHSGTHSPACRVDILTRAISISERPFR
jgi:hypothetical protein